MGNTHDTEIARIEADHIQTKWKTTEDYRWGYTGDRGPETWWVHYPSAAGGKQSPVDIVTEEAVLDSDLSANPLEVFYHSGSRFLLLQCSTSAEDPDDPCVLDEVKILVNTGSTARINVVNSRSYITGGPCKEHTYILEQVHVHWGEADDSGSEHYLNSRPYSAEVHLVHWNEDLYGSYEEAAKSDDGIVILAVFVQLSNSKTNDALTLWSRLLEDIVYREQNIPMPKEFPIRALLPDDLNRYWTYKGSFSTPPCHESVTWVVLEKPFWTGATVLSRFRALRCYGEAEARPDDCYDGQLASNRRPPQPIGTRRVSYADSSVYRQRPPQQQPPLGAAAGTGLLGQPFRGFAGGGGGATVAFRSCVGRRSGDGVQRG